MKVFAVVDENGKLVGTHVPALRRVDVPVSEKPPPNAKLTPLPGQQIHEIEASDELLKLGIEDFHREISKLIPSRR